MAINVIQTADGALNILVQGIGVTPLLEIHLFDNALAAFNDSTVRGDLTEASFSGYAAVDPGWTPPALVGLVAQATSGTANFTYSGSGTTTVYGFFITGGAGSPFFGGNLFPSPITLDTSTTTLQVQVVYTQESKY